MNDKVSVPHRMYAGFLRKIMMPAVSFLSKNRGWRYYQQYIASEYEPVEIRRRRQWKKMIDVLRHAYYNVPFYKNKFDKAGLQPEDIKTEADFRKIPVTTKKELRDNFPHEVIAKNYPLKDLRFSNTSGTSGMPLILVHDHEDINYKYASKLRSRYLMGSEVGESVLRITPNECQPCLLDGTSPAINLSTYLCAVLSNKKYKNQAGYIFMEKGLINPVLHRRNMLPPLKADYSSEDMRFYVEKIRQYKPDVLTGYPLYLYLLAKYMRENTISNAQCAVVDLTAGLSTGWMRDFIGRRFNAPVYQIYGGCEFGRFASSCRQSSGLMHILEDHCYVEFIKNTGEVTKPRELANIIVTSLTNYAMPFIRYEHGDVGWYDNSACRCGRTTKLMDVEGRLQDLIITQDARELTSQFFFEKFLNYPGVKLFQLIQHRVDKVEFKIVRENNEARIDIQGLESVLYEYLGKDVDLQIKLVSYIKPEASGKYRLVKSSTYQKFRCVQDISVPLGRSW